MAEDTTRGGVPRYKSLMNPTLRALRELGGSGTVKDLLLQVTQDLALPRSYCQCLACGWPANRIGVLPCLGENLSEGNRPY